MSYWLRNHWYVCAMVALAIIALLAIPAVRPEEFHPQVEYTTTVASSPDSHMIDLSAGQEFRACCILSYAKDTEVTMRLCELEETPEGAWHTAAVVADFGNRGDCEVVEFEVPRTGKYALEVGSKSGQSLHVTVQYSLES
ncbi:MAG: hypothetical protein JW846_01160 [Dehalococcoidia bacterium]|nr:hypothetical protein [Dehalococcoidia bacterium]